MYRFPFILVLAGLWSALTVAAETPTAAQSETFANPLAAHSLAALSATRERPLFAPNRRPPAPPPPVIEVLPAPTPAVTPPPLVVLGIVAAGNGAHAVLRSRASDKILRARLGDDIEGWKVTQIEARSLVLSHDERSVTFAMFMNSGAKDGRALGNPSKLAVQHKAK